MKNIFVIGLIQLSIILLLSSCDCMQMASGTVFDNDTKEPIDSVYAKPYNRQYGVYTTGKGDFELREISGGLYGCPSMTVELSKDNYESTTVKISSGGYEKVYLKKKNPAINR